MVKKGLNDNQMINRDDRYVTISKDQGFRRKITSFVTKHRIMLGKFGLRIY